MLLKFAALFLNLELKKMFATEVKNWFYTSLLEIFTKFLSLQLIRLSS